MPANLIGSSEAFLSSPEVEKIVNVMFTALSGVITVYSRTTQQGKPRGAENAKVWWCVVHNRYQRLTPLHVDEHLVRIPVASPLAGQRPGSVLHPTRG
jgi:hypothetical protein